MAENVMEDEALGVAERFRLLEPDEYFKLHMARGVRCDGRAPAERRHTSLQCGVVRSAAGSAIARRGATTVIAAVTARLAVAAHADGQCGVVDIRLVDTAPPLPPAAQIRASGQLLTAMARRRLLLDSAALVVRANACVWALRCDLTVVQCDGAPLDCALLALVAALRHARLPEATLPDDADDDDWPTLSDEPCRPLPITETPVAASFAVNGATALADPTQQEMEMLGGALTVVALDGDRLGGLHRFGASASDVVLSDSLLDECVRLTQANRMQCVDLIESALRLAHD